VVPITKDNPRARPPVYTVGHSNLEFSEFASLLKGAAIEALIDVRSSPQSARFPQFTQSVLEKTLASEGITYIFLGEELGGRPDDPEAYCPDGRVDYPARRKSYAFRAGLERVLKESENRSLALMCAEEDPLDCHRFLMISPELVEVGIAPLHIRRGGNIETQEAAETRLLESNGFGAFAANTLFPEARAEALEKAYALQTRKCAFRVDRVALQTR
jgi:uncharacterized protein (DUF488 family)